MSTTTTTREALGVPAVSARYLAAKSSPIRDLLALTQDPSILSFAGGLPAPELFDVEGMREAYAAVLAEEPEAALQYSTTEGDPRLREIVAERYTERGLPTDPAQILVTTGSQQGLRLLADALLDPGDTVVVEAPSYLAALQCFDLQGARIVGAPSDEHGLDTAGLRDLLIAHRPKLLYTVPNFQNPTGRTLPASRRRELAALAEEFGFWLVEDDPYGELRYSGEPIAPVASFGDGDRVISAGSFSKIVAPGLRVGYLRLPAAARHALTVAKQAGDLHTSTVNQAAIVRYLRSGRLPGHVARIRAEYGRRRDAMLAALPGALPDGSAWTHPDGGMFIWAELPEGYDATGVLKTAIEERAAFVPGDAFYATGANPATMRLSFITYPPATIAEGMARLGRAFARG